MKPNTHYTSTETGFSINGSNEIYNRTLYGSHKNDDIPVIVASDHRPHIAEVNLI